MTVNIDTTTPIYMFICPCNANDTNFLKSPNPFGVSALPALAAANPAFIPVILPSLPTPGMAFLLSGSMSMDVMNDVSVRSGLVDVTARKMSSSLCWSWRGVPFRSRICVKR